MQKSFRNIDSGNKGVVNFEQLRGMFGNLFCFAWFLACLCLFVFVCFLFLTAVIVACCGFKQRLFMSSLWKLILHLFISV